MARGSGVRGGPDVSFSWRESIPASGHVATAQTLIFASADLNNTSLVSKPVSGSHFFYLDSHTPYNLFIQIQTATTSYFLLLDAYDRAKVAVPDLVTSIAAQNWGIAATSPWGQGLQAQANTTLNTPSPLQQSGDDFLAITLSSDDFQIDVLPRFRQAVYLVDDLGNVVETRGNYGETNEHNPLYVSLVNDVGVPLAAINSLSTDIHDSADNDILADVHGSLFTIPVDMSQTPLGTQTNPLLAAICYYNAAAGTYGPALTPSTFHSVNVNLPGGSPVTIWTPSGNKSIHVLGFQFTSSVALTGSNTYPFTANGVGINCPLLIPQSPQALIVTFPGNGLLLPPGQALGLNGPASTVNGFVYGAEQ